MLIANVKSLGPGWRDQPLSGIWADHRKRHVGGCFILIYRVDVRATHEQVIFVRAGTHGELIE